MSYRAKCVNCGLVNFAAATSCRRCGVELTSASYAATAPAGYSSQPLPAAGYGPPAEQPQGQAGDFPAYAPQYTGPFQQQAPYAPPKKLKDGLAITSLVIGALGIFSCAMMGVGAMAGLAFGVVALVKANRYPQVYGGKGMAIGGIVTNAFSLFVLMPIIAAIAIPNLFAARKAANEAMAIRHLRTISSAEATYQATMGQGKYGTLQQLIAEGLLSTDAEQKTGYKFEVRASGDRFEAFATPLSYGVTGTGKRSFYMDTSFVIRGADRGGREGSVSDKPLDGPDLASPSPYDRPSRPPRRF